MILALAAVALIWRVELLGRGLPLVGNLVLYFHPLYEHGTRQLVAGKLPLWNPLQGLGVPLLADPQAGLLAPGHALFRVLPFAAALKLNLALHVLLLAAGSYLLARRLGARRLASALAAALAAGNGFAFYHGALIPHFDSLTYTPFVLLFWVAGRGALAGLALALQLATGHPFFAYMTLVAAALLRAPSARALAAAAAASAGAGALTVLGAAAVFSQTARLEMNDASHWVYSVDPDALWRMLVTPLWNRSAHAFTGDPTITSFYVGPAALALAAAGAWRARGGRAAALAVLALVLMLGPHTPVYPALLRAAPGLSLFRYPAQWGAIAALALALLAAAGLSALSRRARAGAALLVLADLAAFCAVAPAPRVPGEFLSRRPRTLEVPELSDGARVAHSPAFFASQAEAGVSAAEWETRLEALAPSRASLFGVGELVADNIAAPRGAREAAARALAQGPRALERLGVGLLVDAGKDGELRAERLSAGPRARALPSGAARVAQEAPGRVSLALGGGERVLLADSWAPGWRAFVDGRQTPAFSDSGLLSCALSPGAREAVFVYDPAYARAGAALASLTLLVLLAWALRRASAAAALP